MKQEDPLLDLQEWEKPILSLDYGLSPQEIEKMHERLEDESNFEDLEPSSRDKLVAKITLVSF